MSWTDELYKVYENNCGRQDLDEQDELLPVSHSTANAQIEVTIDEDGKFVSAKQIEDKKDSVTIIPVTENSGSRGQGNMPHPLADKLVYIAGDYVRFVTGKRSDNTDYYQAYMEQLRNWKESQFGHPAVDAIYAYLDKKMLMQDLINSRVLIVDESGTHLKDKVKILGIAQEDAFVRFRVNYRDLFKESNTWEDKSLYDSFIQYNNSNATGNKQLCYATGKILPVTYKHPQKIRNAGDKAKLISSNDESGFTYRGRFVSKEEAISVSYDFSQKMHIALKWLISRQGIFIGSLVIVAWESNSQHLPNILGNPELDEEDCDEDELEDWSEENSSAVVDTMPAYKQRLKKAIWGNANHIDIKSKAMVMGLDAATTGRLSMSMYSEMETSEFLRNIEKWHTDTSWRRFIPKEKKNGIHSFTLYEIADCAFGTEQSDFIKCKDEIKKDAICRLIPCVIEGRRLPADILLNLVNRASRPQAYSRSYNWRKVVECACGMLKKSMIERKQDINIKEDDFMAVDHECKERDYLYGRLLAIADAAEAVTYDNDTDRVTNARRYFESFVNRPYQTWGVIYNRLVPYVNKMSKPTRVYYTKLLSEVEDKFTTDNFQDNTRLKPLFLLAYQNQLNEIYTNKSKKEEDK